MLAIDRWSALLLALAVCSSCSSPGRVLSPEATLLASDDETDSIPAVSLSGDGTRALVSVSRDDTAGGVDAGSARVFVRTGTSWSEEATLVAPDGAAGDGLGYSVALSVDGLRALVGAPWDDTSAGDDAGSARVFVRAGASWSEEATLLAPDVGPDSFFGSSVALSGDGTRALVGASENIVVGRAGSARVFVRTGTSWSEEASLFAADGSSDFGSSVALSSDGTRALIGAEHGGPGSARVFVRTGTSWSEEAALSAPLGAEASGFGAAVAVSADGTRALVAGDDSLLDNVGAFRREGTTWSAEGTLPGWVSNALALSGDGTRALGITSGEAAGVFTRADTGWSEEAALRVDGTLHAIALSADGTRAIAGFTSGGTASASVYVLTP